jgi:hypothetical protein
MTIHQAAVAVELLDGQWVVHYMVDGKVMHRSFGLEEHAKNFAAGQRVRLGLPRVPYGP